MATTALIFDLIAKDSASPAFNRVAVSADRAAVATDRATASADKAGAGFLGLSKKMAVAAGAFAIGDVIVHAVSAASNYQKQLTLVQTQAGASAKQVKMFGSALLSLSGNVATAPDQLTTSLYHVYSALRKVGATAPQMLNTVKIAAEGAKVGNTDLEDTTNSLTATLASGIVKFNQAGKAMGALNAIVGAGDMHFSDLNQALSTGLLVTMKTYGVSLKDAGAALAVFGDNNIRGAEAATKLRMAVQDLVKPASSAGPYFDEIHLSMQKLQDTLTQHGLNAALVLLKDHMDAVGITGNKVGAFLVNAFTKKAGAGLGILLTRLKQFQDAGNIITKQSNSFGSAWATTTRTVSFAFQRIGAEFSAAEIIVGQKLLPAVSAAAQWLGKNLPTAIRTLGAILAPTAHMLGTVFVAAWHGVSTAAQMAGSALASVGSFLAVHSQGVKVAAATVLALWAAYKGYTIVSGAVAAIRLFSVTTLAAFRGSLSAIGQWGSTVISALNGSASASGRTALIMERDMLAVGRTAAVEQAAMDELAAQTAEAYAAMARSSSFFTQQAIANAEEQAAAARAAANASAESAAEVATAAQAASAAVDEASTAAELGWGAIAGPIGLAVVGIGAFVTALGHSSSAAKLNTADVQSMTAAIEADSGALGKNTAARVANALQTSGAAAKARMLGLSLHALGDAAMNGGAPLEQFITQLKAIERANYQTYASSHGAVRSLNSQGQAAKDLIGILTGENDTVNAGVQAYRNKKAMVAGATAGEKQNTAATQQATNSLRLQQEALAAATTALFQFITAELSQKSAVLGFQAGLLGLAANIKTTGSSLDNNTVKGNANRQMLVGLLQSAEAAAQGSKNQTAALIANVKAIEEHAAKAGFDKQQVDALVRSLKLTPRDIRSQLTVTADTSQAVTRVTQLQGILNRLHAHGISYGQYVSVVKGIQLQGNAAGGGLPEGVSAVGEQGPELVLKRGGTAHVLSNSQSKAFLAATGMRAPGFAKGTSLVGLARRYSDWNPQIMAAIAMAESSGRANAHNYNLSTGDDSYGLWQINMLGSMGPARRREFGIKSDSALYNPSINVRAAHDIWRSSGYGAWTTYTSGAYRQYLGTDGHYMGGGSGSGPQPGSKMWRNRHRHHLHSQLVQGGASFRSSQHPNRIIEAGGQFYVGGQAYGSRALAEQALRQQQAQARIQARNALRSGLYSWIHSFGSPSAERKAFRALLPDLRDLGAGDKALAHLEAQNKRLDAIIARRLAMQKKLDAARAKLRADRQARAQTAQSVSGAITGFFDLTGAGAGAHGRVSARSMLAQETQALHTIRLWANGIDTLRRKGLSNTLLRRFAEAGPSTWPQVKALLDASPKLFKEILHESAAIDRIGRREGWQVGRDLYNPRIHADRQRVHRDERRMDEIQRRQLHVEEHMDRLINVLTHGELHMRLVGGDRAVGRFVETGQNKNKARK